MAKEKIRARARTQYTDYMVKEPMELMEFLAAKMPDASRTKLKSLLSKRIVYVDSVITTQYNFPLKPGMKVQISREKGRKEFSNRLLKIVYEDAYIIVVEKMQYSSFFVLHSSFMLLHDYSKEAYFLSVQRFHAMWQFGVEIQAVSLVQD